MLVGALLLGCNAGVIDARADEDIAAVQSRITNEVIRPTCPNPDAYGPTCGLVLSYTQTPAFMAKFKATHCGALDDDACDALLARQQDAWLRGRYVSADWDVIQCDTHELDCELRLLQSHDARVRASAARDEEAVESRRAAEHDADTQRTIEGVGQLIDTAGTLINALHR